MKSRLKSFVLLLVFVLAACNRATPTPTAVPTSTPPPTATLGQPRVETTPAPDAEAAARAYLDAWVAEDYASMYARLTSISHDALTEEDFTKKYHNVAAEAALEKWEYQILAALVNSPFSAQVSYRVTLHSVLVGDISRETTMNLSREGGEWRVQWDDALILPELKGGNHLKMEYQIPARANIYDREGNPLVAHADAVAIGVDTTKLPNGNYSGLLELLQQVTGREPNDLESYLEYYRLSGWYYAVGDVTAEQAERYLNALSSYDAIVLSPFQARYYFDVAPHITGYMSLIQENEVEAYKRLGYNFNERVGRDGLELTMESTLAGRRGGKLYVIGPDNAVITILAESAGLPGQAVYTTIDETLQQQAQAALSGWRGAVVVLERDTGRVLASASSPGFNPNLFAPENFNSNAGLTALFSDSDTPLYNRAEQGQYPLGSVFKIITMAAALESGLYTPDSQYECGYFFTEIPGVDLHDWTWTHFQDDGKTPASGNLTLSEGLMKSCNPWFYHIGRDFFIRGMVNNVADMARGFGLGGKTGIEIFEQAGQIPTPGDELQATSLAIGQGDTMVTPLQVADFVAAMGNGGNLYVPHVVERIVPPSGEPTYVFTSTLRATLPVSAATLKAIQDAMVTVVGTSGTARSVGRYLGQYNIAVAGKTGTAESGSGKSHAWFAGYTFEGRSDKPDIAVVVILENAGEGSEMAAPIFMGLVKLYFAGPPRNTFPWESSPGVWKPTITPTSNVTDTPEPPTDTPEPTETPEP